MLKEWVGRDQLSMLTYHMVCKLAPLSSAEDHLLVEKTTGHAETLANWQCRHMDAPQLHSNKVWCHRAKGKSKLLVMCLSQVVP